MATPRKAEARSKPGATILICKNRRALHTYELGERFEAGLSLTGSEVKACRQGKAHLNDAYVVVSKSGEPQLLNAHIGDYAHAAAFAHIKDRTRGLLLHKHEIEKLASRIRDKGLVAIPLSLYFKGAWVKVEIGLGKGRSHEDKRQVIKEREVKREIERAMRSRRR